MKSILKYIFILFILPIQAQHFMLDSVQEATSGMIQMDKNVLQFADDAPHLNYFFSQLDSVFSGEKKKLHIFHIGGSHIQADFYSNKIRTYLQNMNSVSMSQRGFVFPYHLAHTNNPLNYRVEANKEKWKGYRCSRRDSVPWGLAGVTAAFQGKIDTIFIKSNHKNYTREEYCFNSLKVFYNTWNSNYKLTVLDNALLESETNDSILKYKQYNFYSALDSIAVKIEKIDTLQQEPFYLMGLEFGNAQPGIEYTSIGANGASFKSYGRCAFFEEQLAMYKPDLFIVSVGTNDGYMPADKFKPEEFRKRYENFIQMVQRVNPQCAMILTVPNDDYYRKRYPNKNTRLQRDIMLELAQKYQLAVWDLYGIMGGLGSSNNWYKNGLMPRDRIHFTITGYSVKADLFLEAFVTQWEKVTNRPETSLLTYFKTLDEQN